MANFTRPTLPTRGCVFFKRLLSVFFLAPAAVILGAWSFQDGEEKVTIQGNLPLQTVFRSIQKQTGYHFFYAPDIVNDKERVNVDVKGEKMEDVLQKMLGKEYVWTYNENVVRISKKKLEERSNRALPERDSNVTQITISGAVTDAKGAPIPGATVMVKGTKDGANTDGDGKFSLPSVSPNAVLVISSIGYEKMEIPVKGRTILAKLNVDVNDLDETVVVAYNTTTQRANTGAVTVVKGEQIRDLPNRSFDKSLQGLVPGLLVTSGTGQPGGGVSNFVLRGIATAADPQKGSTVRNPLIVIDGIPISQDHYQLYIDNTQTPTTNPLAQLNPSDIETLTVLKDAAAIALYGARASNGVIIITTKKGRSGKTIFSFRHQTDVASRLDDKVKVLNQQEYLELLYESYRNFDPSLTDTDIKADLQSKFPTQADGSFYPASNWFTELYNDHAVTISNDLSMSGGNDKSSFYLNLEYAKQKGVVKKTGYDRKSLRFNFENRPASWLKLGLNSILSYNIQDYGGGLRGYNGPIVAAMSPLNPVRWADGSYVLNFTTGGGPQSGDEFANPVAAAEYNINRNTAFRGLSKIYGEFSFLDYFKFTSNIGIDFMLSEAKEKADPRLYDPGNFSSGTGRIEEQDVRRANFITNNILRFDKTLNTHHTLNILLGQEAQILTQKNLLVAVNNLALPYYDQINSPGTTIFRHGGSHTKETLQSFFGQVNYGYKNKYFLSSSIRRDGSSRFGEEKRYGTYWSTGAGWVISSEPFMTKTSSWLDYLKIRGSIGAAGNAAAINALTRYDQLQNGFYQGGTAVYPTIEPGSPDVHWEQTFILDAGMEIRLLKERIAFTADIYKKNTSDLIYTISLPLNTGYYQGLTNIGKMTNSGVEISFSVDIMRNKNFNWNINTNWSTNQNKLVKANVPLASISTNQLGNKEGENFNSFYMVRWAGVDPSDGSPQWLDKNGKITKNYTYGTDDKVFVGKPQPDGFGAITNKFVYKAVELSAMLYYQYGYQIYISDDLVNDGQYPYMNQDKRVLDRWQKPGDNSANPIRKLNNSDLGDATSTRYLFDGDHIRLQNLVLAYSFPKRMLNRFNLSMLKVYVQGNNLAIWTKFPGDDPSNTNVGGMVGMVYPNQRSFSVGLNVNF